MQFPIAGIFDEAENRYLQPEELRHIGQYVSSLPARMSAYRAVRDQEVAVMQQVANQLEMELPDVATATLERSIKNAMLSLRYCALAMLLNDENVVQKRLLNWLSESIQLHDTAAIDTVLFQRLKQQLRLALNAQQMATFEPFLNLVEAIIPAQEQEEEELLTVAGIF